MLGCTTAYEAVVPWQEQDSVRVARSTFWVVQGAKATCGVQAATPDWLLQEEAYLGATLKWSREIP